MSSAATTPSPSTHGAIPEFDQVLLHATSNPYLLKLRYWAGSYALILYTFTRRSTDPCRLRLEISRMDKDFRQRANNRTAASELPSSSPPEQKLARITTHLTLTRIRPTRWFVECTKVKGVSCKQQPLEMYADFERQKRAWTLHGPVRNIMEAFTFGTIEELGWSTHLFTNVTRIEWRLLPTETGTTDACASSMHMTFRCDYLYGLIRWTVNQSEHIVPLAESSEEDKEDDDSDTDTDREDDDSGESTTATAAGEIRIHSTVLRENKKKD